MTALFRDQTIIFADGASGAHVDIPTADPVNYHQAISAPETMTRTVIDAKLFLPGDRRAGEKLPAVIVVPGSAGVSANHLRHAETIVSLGAAVLVIDPFGARGVTSTIANQVQYSFAASAYDVLAGARVLAGMPEIDASRIGAHGHSRGGSAVVSAAMRRFAVPVMGRSPCLRAVFAAYPWSGHQFLDPDIGGTLLRAMIGDRDGWCLPQQVQGHIQAIRLRGGDASLRIVADAAHSFDRETPVEMIANAAVAPGAPTAYIAGDGAFIHPVEGRPDPSLTDRDIMIYAMKAGYGVKGATMGGKPGQPALFREEIVRFWRRALWETPR